MRFVDRLVEPRALSDANSRASRELARNRELLRKSGAQGKAKLRFSLYRDETVRFALESLFFGKCAYCESKYWAMAPVDIEHFRPKGSVDGEEGHVGYWWLAASWNNLLPSCIDCNRRRSHLLAEMPLGLEHMCRASLESSSKRLLGKGSAFPIAGQRARSELDDLEAEDALLLDPTRDRDIDFHLTYYINRSKPLGLVLPNMIAGKPSRRGLETIHTFGLNRLRLVQERTIILRKLEFLCWQISNCVELVDELKGQKTKRDRRVRAGLEFQIRAIQDELSGMASRESPYSAMVLAWKSFVEKERAGG